MQNSCRYTFPFTEILFTLTLCFLFIKYLFIYLKASLSHSYAPNLAISKSWFNVSKTFDRFMKIAQIYPSSSNIFFQITNTEVKQCCVLWVFLNPAYCFDNLSFMKSLIWWCMFLSKAFYICDKTPNTEYSLSNSPLFLKTGLTSTSLRIQWRLSMYEVMFFDM